MNNVLFAMASLPAGISQASTPVPRVRESWLQVAFRSTKPPSGGTAEFNPGSTTSKQQLEEEAAATVCCQPGETVESGKADFRFFSPVVDKLFYCSIHESINTFVGLDVLKEFGQF